MIQCQITLGSKHPWKRHAATYSQNWAMRNRDCLCDTVTWYINPYTMMQIEVSSLIWSLHILLTWYINPYTMMQIEVSSLFWSLHILLHVHIVLGVGPVASSTDPLDTWFWECGASYFGCRGSTDGKLLGSSYPVSFHCHRSLHV